MLCAMVAVRVVIAGFESPLWSFPTDRVPPAGL